MVQLNSIDNDSFSTSIPILFHSILHLSEFAEHIPGFFGRAKTKSAKKRVDASMLWKRCLSKKSAEEDEGGKKGGKVTKDGLGREIG